jgi:nucleoid-associated protein YgaU
VSLPINFLGRKFAEARLEIVQPAENRATIPLHFNPSEYKLSKENTFAEIPIPGLASPPLQYVRGGSRVLAMDVLVDTSDDPKKNVHTEYVAAIEGAMAKDGKLHAPPIVMFVWGPQPKFTGVLTSLEVNYLLFHTDGTPLRAKLGIKLKEYRPVKVQLKEVEQTSPDVEKRYVVRTGETLSSISSAVYRDPSHWREIARANRITDPTALVPGTVLTVPALPEDRR